MGEVFMNLEHYHVTSCIPHQRTMMLLDSLVAYDRQNREIIAKITVNEHRPYWDGPRSRLRPHWYAEIMAQTVAANYYFHTNQQDTPPKQGFLTIITSASIKPAARTVKPGDTLHITARFETEMLPFGSFYCEVKNISHELVACANMKFLIDEKGEFKG
jgi:predicted hotdog family 3-hydroxylacyl-ACP dehydratase